MRRTSSQQAGTATTTSARPKPSAAHEAHALVGVLHGLADQVLAGDAEMRRAALQELRDLAGRDEVDLHAGQAVDLALVAARRAGADDRSPALASAALHCSIRRPLEGSAQTSLPLAVAVAPSWRRSLQHREQALGVDAGADGRHAAPARRHRPAGRRSGRRRRRGSWGRARARSPRTRSPCSIRGCGRTRRRTPRPPDRRRPWRSDRAGAGRRRGPAEISMLPARMSRRIWPAASRAGALTAT